jgi:hypothetical protein
VFIPADVWFRAFLLTVAVEAPAAALLLRRWEPSWPRLLALVVFANLASHLAVWFVFTQLFLLGTFEYVLAAEGWAVACEALFYAVAIRGLPVRWAILASVVANALSFLVGRVVIGLWPNLFW